MITQAEAISPPDRRRGDKQRLHALLLLLAMCFAVVPHVTLAASPMRAPSAASLPHGPLPGVEVATTEAAPCHRPEPQSREHPAPGMPLCCVIGCGLIAKAPAVVLPARVILWSRPALARAEPIVGISPEPAKPPPRTEPARS